jgi:hypothetical protein
VSSYGLNFWAPHLIRSLGTQNPTMIGLLTAVPYLCGAISDGGGGPAVGRQRRAAQVRRRPDGAGALGFFSAGVFDHQTGMLVAALAVMGAGVVASIPAFWALPPKLVTGAGAAGGIALINTLGQLGGIVSPVDGRAACKDLTGSTTPALYVIGGAALLCARPLPLSPMPTMLGSSAPASWRPLRRR